MFTFKLPIQNRCHFYCIIGRSQMHSLILINCTTTALLVSVTHGKIEKRVKLVGCFQIALHSLKVEAY